MPVITIKAKAGRSPERIEELRKRVRDATAELLEVKPDRVLVIYEELAANIYFDAPPTK